MATVTGLTAARILEILNDTIESAMVDGDDLIFTRHDGSNFNAGDVRGPQGDTGPAGEDVLGLTAWLTNAMLENTAGQPGAASSASTWTPEVQTTATPVTYGTGATRTGQYIQIGKLCFAKASVLFGASGMSPGTGSYGFSLPVESVTGPTALAVGSLRISALTGGHEAYFNGLILNGASFGVRYQSAWPSGNEVLVSATGPAVPTNSTRFEWSVLYETV